MDERMRRQWAATEAQALGRGGLQAVSAAIKMSPNTIRKGINELAWRENNPGSGEKKFAYDGAGSYHVGGLWKCGDRARITHASGQRGGNVWHPERSF